MNTIRYPEETCRNSLSTKRIILLSLVTAMFAALSLTLWLAFPYTSTQELPPNLKSSVLNSYTEGRYGVDLPSLLAGFEPQIYRSFCGPASIATVLRAYGDHTADQRRIFPSVSNKIKTFYTGLTLSELSMLATSVGLKNEPVFADSMTRNEFRLKVKDNLAREGDYVLINYDRRALKEDGRGHISPIAAYDDVRDEFLILDEASYKYPFTWVPAESLYNAMHTRDEDKFRGLLFIFGK